MTIGGILFAAWAFLTCIAVLLVLTAPHGHQDASGYHDGEP